MILTFSVLFSCSLLFTVPIVLDAILTREEKRFVDSEEEVEDWVGVDIPAGAEDVRYDSYLEFSNTLWLRLDISDPEVRDTYLADLGFTEQLASGDDPFANDIRDDVPRWWRPDEAQPRVGGEVTLVEEGDDPRTISIVIDQSDADTETLYIRFYENH